MTKLNHLLAATDLSAPARHAAERAALVSKETGAPLDLLHVADLAPLEKFRQLMGESPEELKLRLLDTAKEKLRELAEALLKQHGVSAGARVVFGPLLAELFKEADAMATDLIVCGARGESFMRHLLLGSTAERMLSRTKCPLLVVKQAAHEPYRTLLLPVDFSPASLQAIKNARAVAAHAEIVMLHVFEVPFESHLRYASVDDDTIKHYRTIARQEAVRKLHALSEEAGLPPYATRFVVVHGAPSLRIIEQEQEQNCDLIVMGKHGESALEDLLLGSVTKRVLAESQCDVLVSM
ncbi:Universal stress protein family 4 [Georgfuchsia toluolica]|uniref:Universal stress protein family 4 n=1 Tax=Georgfuchsia toluolica TaxID=424218 RepID=A0A916J240_9PROT|nr:universal stress protein [Georgfuchsia toluolica]CAG4883177.1 Universal stress protein family 4 [Georgfuchsia toluolica]